MTTSKLIVIALAALLVFAGSAAAMPGQASSADAADEHQPDDPAANASEHADGNETDTDGNVTDADHEHDENASVGPPTEMPDETPDHVAEIHQLIRDKICGCLTGAELGAAISGVVSSADADQSQDQVDAADEQSEDAGDEQSDQREDAQTNAADAGPTGDLPEQAADHVSNIHDVIVSFLNGDGDGNLGDEVSSTTG